MHEPPAPQIRKRIASLETREARDTLATHGDDNLAALGGVANIPAQTIMEFANPNLAL